MTAVKGSPEERTRKFGRKRRLEVAAEMEEFDKLRRLGIS
jgi:hypothetical protein